MTILLPNCSVRVLRGSTGDQDGERVIPHPSDSAVDVAEGSIQKLKAPVLIPDQYGGRGIDQTVNYRIRVDAPVDPADTTGAPANLFPTDGDVAIVTDCPASPFLVGRWHVARVEPDTGDLASLLLFVNKAFPGN